ncbi:hypothetical protein [Bacillus amyloliquefaciens]|uniref:hypothetical protein n=1 Tax=Bacillus amyloliquefaciens TaxID=1390 RepID=UPI001ABDEEB9|nr:hypothetical protein [Bacillus amyloliquefaciens]QTG87300.1 hypothetical protein J4048_20450 [Bacillus amyloliquefaciens]
MKEELAGMEYWEIQKFLVAALFYREGIEDPGFVLALSNERFLEMARGVEKL